LTVRKALQQNAMEPCLLLQEHWEGKEDKTNILSNALWF